MASALEIVPVTSFDNLTVLAGDLVVMANSGDGSPLATWPDAQRFASASKGITSVTIARDAMRMVGARSWTGVIRYGVVTVGLLTMTHGQLLGFDERGDRVNVKGPRLQWWLGAPDVRPAGADRLSPLIIPEALNRCAASALTGVPWCVIPVTNTYLIDCVTKASFVPRDEPKIYRRFEPSSKYPALWQLFAYSPA